VIFTSGDMGRLLRAWREQVGLTQEQVSQLPGIECHQSEISMAETGYFWEAQQRCARLYFFELEEFEAEELREIIDPEALAKALYKARVFLRLDAEVIAERIGLSTQQVIAAESKGHATAIMAYLRYALRDMARDEQTMKTVVAKALAPWYWKTPKERTTHRPKGTHPPRQKLWAMPTE
jgi:hypothetical protein